MSDGRVVKDSLRLEIVVDYRSKLPSSVLDGKVVKDSLDTTARYLSSSLLIFCSHALQKIGDSGGIVETYSPK